MYQPGTILELRDPQSTDDKPFAYDRVKVIGRSPVMHAQTVPDQWQGVEAQGILIQPAGDTFGPNLDEPLGKLQEMYEIVELPDTDALAAAQPVSAPVIAPSPEDVFKATAREDAQANVRQRTTVPLQNDGKTPEQVLAEKSLKDAQVEKAAEAVVEAEEKATTKPKARRAKKESADVA